MLKHLSWNWNGAEFSCLYTAPFDPVFGAEARHVDEPIACATPADLIACLKANPEACAEVLTALDPYAYAVRDDAIARAEQAERELGEAKVKLAEAERELMGVKRNYNTLYEMANKEGKALRAKLAGPWKQWREEFSALDAAQAKDSGPGAAACFSGSYRSGRNPGTGSADGTDPGGAHVQAPVTPVEPAGTTRDTTKGGDADADTGRPRPPSSRNVAGPADSTSAEGPLTDAERAASVEYEHRPGVGYVRAYDAAQAKDSGGSGAATPEGGRAAPTSGPMPPPDPAGAFLASLSPPATLADLSALEERIVERVARACLSGAERHTLSDGTRLGSAVPLRQLADELRRKP